MPMEILIWSFWLGIKVGYPNFLEALKRVGYTLHIQKWRKLDLSMLKNWDLLLAGLNEQFVFFTSAGFA